MRNWIDLFENTTPLTVYHGGCGEIADVRTPFFTTTHYEMARSYATVKGRGDGVITAFDLARTAKIATDTTMMTIADSLGVEHKNTHASDMLYGKYSQYAPIMAKLIQDGYQVVFIHDFGYHDNFSEEPTYVVLDPTVLSNPRIVEKNQSIVKKIMHT